MFNKRWPTLLTGSLDVIVLIILDQWLKFWAIANLQNQPNRQLIQGFLHLTYVENTGAAFGFLSGFGGAQVLLAVVKIILMISAIVYYLKLPYEPRFLWLRLPLMFIIAGGMGNLFDRVWHGFVVDMLAFSFFNFPVFNLADVYVTVGVFCFAVAVIFIVKDAPLFGIKEAEKPDTPADDE